MAVFKVDFVGGQIRETPPNAAPKVVTGFEAIADSLLSASQRLADTHILNPGDTNINLLCSLSAASAVALISDGPVQVKLNGDSIGVLVSNTLIVFGTVSGVLGSNPSSTQQRTVQVYAAI